MKENEITNDILSNFYYDESSNTCLRWKVKPSDRVRINACAGRFMDSSNKRNTHSIVKVKGKGYVCSRIIWVMHYGQIPTGMVIDHLDGNPMNNRIENLSCKTHGENMRNCKTRKQNTSGFTGVRWVGLNNNKYTYAEGTSTVYGKMTTKKFSVSKFGLLPAFKMAVLWRLARMEELNAIGMNYTERHITAGLCISVAIDNNL